MEGDWVEVTMSHLEGTSHLVRDGQADEKCLGHGQVVQPTLQSLLSSRAGGTPYLCFWEKGWPRMAMCCWSSIRRSRGELALIRRP